MRHKKATLTAVLATVVCFAVAGVVIHRYRNPAPLTETTVQIAGEEAPRKVTTDMSPEESGPNAGPRYFRARQQHLANREVYLAVPTVAAPADLAAARRLLAPLLAKALSEPADRAAMTDRRLPRGAADGLVDHLALVFMVASGLEHGAYTRSLPAEAVVTVNPESASLRGVFHGHGLGSLEEDPAEVRRKLYELNQSHRDGKNHAKRWAATTDGFHAAAAWNKATDDRELFHRADLDTIKDKLARERAYGLWIGAAAQGAFVLTQPPTPLATAAAETPVLVVHVGMIVHSVDDAYPVDATVWFDPDTKRWWTLSVIRRSTIRVTNGPPLTY